MDQFQQHLLLMDHGGVQASAADSKGMKVELPIFKNLSEMSALQKLKKRLMS